MFTCKLVNENFIINSRTIFITGTYTYLIAESNHTIKYDKIFRHSTDRRKYGVTSQHGIKIQPTPVLFYIIEFPHV